MAASFHQVITSPLCLGCTRRCQTEQCVQPLRGQRSPEIFRVSACQGDFSVSLLPPPTARSVFFLVFLFDVQRKGGRRHQPIAAAAARHHGDAAPTVSVEAAAGTGGRRGRGCGRGGLLELLLVDFALFGPTILEPDLHLEVRKSCFYMHCTSQTNMLLW